MGALDPALGLLSALTSLPAAVYYARLLGAAAVHPVRDAAGRTRGLRGDQQWERAFFLFVGGTALVAAVTVPLNIAFASLASEHAAFGAALLVVLWPQARESTRLLLILLLLGAGAARMLHTTETLASVAAGYAIGLCCALTVRRRLARRPLG